MPLMPPLRHLFWFVIVLVSIPAAVVVRRFMMEPMYSSSFPSGDVHNATTTSQENTFLEGHLMEVTWMLQQNGFEKYAEELNISIASVVWGHRRIKSATIFAPFDLAAEIYPPDLFTLIVMRQIILGRFYHSDLLSLPDRTRLATLTGEQVLVRVNYSQFSIGKTILMKPDLGSNAAFVVHGINTGFILEDHGHP